jgi:hypothetical protein
MEYTLITNSGKVLSFHVEAAAKIFLAVYGGTMICNSIINIQ